jgi:hypothetical protein
MVMAPMEVPGEGGGAAASRNGAAGGGQGQGVSAPPATQAQLSVAPPQVRAFRRGALNVVVFAAGTDSAAPAYDGIRIELRAP